MGGAGISSGHILTFGNLAGVTIGRSVLGGDGLDGAGIFGFGSLGPVKIGGDLQGGSEVLSGNIRSNGTLTSVTLGGSVLGGEGFNSAFIYSNGNLGPVKIGRDVQGGSGAYSGQIATGAALASLTIGGSLVGGSADHTGVVLSQGNLGPVKIGGDLVGGSVTGNASLEASGYIEGQRIARVWIGGSVFAGSVGFFSGFLRKSGAIHARDDLGPITVKGNLVGHLFNPVIISARGLANPTATGDVAIAGVRVGGRVELVRILAGYSYDPNSGAFVARNADARVGAVAVGRDWIASSLAAGIAPGADGFFGTDDDVRASGPGVKDDPSLASKIVSLTIKGQALGSTAIPGDHYGVVAERIAALTIGDTVVPLTANTERIPVGGSGDLWLTEV
jgi:hypothetical protein